MVICLSLAKGRPVSVAGGRARDAARPHARFNSPCLQQNLHMNKSRALEMVTLNIVYIAPAMDQFLIDLKGFQKLLHT
jgi:hypothetical protein